MIYGSSQSNPNYSNFRGSQTYAPYSRQGYNVPFIGTQVKKIAPAPATLPSTSNPIQNNNNNPQPSGPSQEDILRQQQEELNRQIEADYSVALNSLSTAETDLKGQASLGLGQLESGAAAAKNEIQNTQALAEQGVQAQLSTGANQYQSATQQARDLFRQTQQQNIAQLSALGISSSSVSEALSEKLGVETARRIGALTGSWNEIQQGATKELSRIQTYYKGRVDDISREFNNQKAQINQTLMTGLNQINNSRYEAAAGKAARRGNLMSQVQSQLASLEQQKRQFEQSLQLWKEQKSAALQPLTQGDFQTLFNNQKSVLESQYDPKQYDILSNQEMDTYGRMKGSFSVKPKKNAIFTDPQTGQQFDENGLPI